VSQIFFAIFRYVHFRFTFRAVFASLRIGDAVNGEKITFRHIRHKKAAILRVKRQLRPLIARSSNAVNHARKTRFQSRFFTSAGEFARCHGNDVLSCIETHS
jgi:hypothetical protein